MRKIKAPLCACGCGNQVTESVKYPGHWNTFFSRHGRERNEEQFKKPPRCECGCGQAVDWIPSRQAWRKLAQHHTVPTKAVWPFFLSEELAAILPTLESVAEGSRTGVSVDTLRRRVKDGLVPAPVRVQASGAPGYRLVYPQRELRGLIPKSRMKRASDPFPSL